MCGRRQSSRKRRRLEDLPESETVQQCLQAIGSGEAHIATAIRFARAVVNDGFKHPTVMEFASLGGPSLEIGNGERDLHRWVDCRAHNLELWNLKLQLQMPNSKRTELVAVPTLLPWVLMHALWTADRWETSMLGPTGLDGLRKFWGNASGQRWCDEHPALPHLDFGSYNTFGFPLRRC